MRAGPTALTTSVRRSSPGIHLILMGAAAGLFASLVAVQPALAVGTTIGLGTAGSYSVLAGQSVTNTGPSTLSGNVGVSPGTEVTGFPPGVTGGVIHSADAQALQAQADLTTAYDNAAGQASDAAVGAELGGQTLTAGVYTASSSTQLTGPLTLDAQGDPDAVFIFQIGSALTTASNSSVVLLNDAQSCHVFWQVGSSAALGTNTSFVGTIMALTSVTADTGATVEGRALARNGSVTLDTNVFTDVQCATTPTSTPTSPSATASSNPTETGTATGSPVPSVTTTATASTRPTGTTAPTSRRSATAVAGADAGSNDDSSVGPLAYTGGGVSGPLIAIAAAAAALGVALVLVVRRRRMS